jgi:aromatic ring-opening dioxygenase LigB subunit
MGLCQQRFNRFLLHYFFLGFLCALASLREKFLKWLCKKTICHAKPRSSQSLLIKAFLGALASLREKFLKWLCKKTICHAKPQSSQSLLIKAFLGVRENLIFYSKNFLYFCESTATV